MFSVDHKARLCTERIFNTFDKLFHSWGAAVYDSISMICLELFAAAVMCLVMWNVIQYLLNDKPFDKSVLFTKWFKMICLSSLLASGKIFSTTIFIPVYSFFVDIGLKIVSLSPFSAPVDGLPALIKLVDQQVQVSILDKIWEIPAGGILGYFVKFAVLASFVFLKFIFITIVALSELQVIVLFSISPLLILFYMFDSTKQFADQGIKMFLNGCFRLLFASASMSLSLSILDVSGLLPMASGGGIVSYKELSESITFVPLLVMCWFCILIHIKSTSWADTVSGASIGVGAETVFAGLASGVSTFVKMGGLKALPMLSGDPSVYMPQFQSKHMSKMPNIKIK